MRVLVHNLRQYIKGDEQRIWGFPAGSAHRLLVLKTEGDMPNVPELFGSMVFNQSVMKERLPKETFRALKKTLDDGEPLKIEVANVVAHAMKEWAIEKGATHFTHWFQPLTGITAEKHDSFINPQDVERNSLKANPTHRVFRRADIVLLLRREDTRFGTRLRIRS